MSYIGLYNNNNGGGSGGGGSGVTAEQVQTLAFNHAFDTGVADAYVVTLNPASVGSGLGQEISFIPSADNATSTPTLDFGIGPQNIVLPGGAPVAPGNIVANQLCFVKCDASGQVVLINPIGSSGGSVTPENIQNQDFTAALDTGAVNAYVVDLSPAVTAYSNNLTFTFIPANSNTITNPTVDVNGLGPIGFAPSAPGGGVGIGDIAAFVPITITYLDGEFFIVNPRYAGQTFYTIPTNFYNFNTTGGSVNAYTLSIRSLGNIPSGTSIFANIHTPNTGPSTLIVTNATGHTASGNIRTFNNSTNLLPGTLASNTMYHLVVSPGGGFRLINQIADPIQSFAGDPNTNVAGNQYTLCIDNVNNFLYYCITAGDAATAVWNKIVV